MTINGKEFFTYKELAERWGCHRVTVRVDLILFKVRPVHFVGRQPFFSPESIAELERKRIAQRSKKLGFAVGGAK